MLLSESLVAKSSYMPGGWRPLVFASTRFQGGLRKSRAHAAAYFPSLVLRSVMTSAAFSQHVKSVHPRIIETCKGETDLKNYIINEDQLIKGGA